MTLDNFLANAEVWKRQGALLFDRFGLTANMVTCVGVLIVLLANLTLIWFGVLWIAGLLILLGLVMDAFDGALARLQKKDSPFGAWLDTTCDRTSEFIIAGTLSLWYFTTPSAQAVCLVTFCLGFMTTFVKTAAVAEKVWTGWKEKAILGYPGRVVILVSGMLLSGLSRFEIAAEEQIFFVAVLTLLTFNFITLLWRVGKIVRYANSS